MRQVASREKLFSSGKDAEGMLIGRFLKDSFDDDGRQGGRRGRRR
jgi:hypothetical protein